MVRLICELNLTHASANHVTQKWKTAAINQSLVTKTSKQHTGFSITTICHQNQ